MLIAITRLPSPRMNDCEVWFGDRQPIDLERARFQHAAYEAALSSLGARVVSLPSLEHFPDSMFVEDPAIILDEVAILTRPGAESRRGEVAELEPSLQPYRKLLKLEAPATLEGGDVMRLGKTLYVGLSQRTNVAGIQQLAQLVASYGYWVTPIEVRGCLHLKSACCALDESTVLLNRQWIDPGGLCGLRMIDVDPSEPDAANVLPIGGTLLMAEGAPRTRARLEQAGYRIRTLDISELQKADAAMTCSSLLFAP